jgi:hypothetical protein
MSAESEVEPEPGGTTEQTRESPLLVRHGECEQYADGSWTCWPDSVAGAVAPQHGTDRDLELFRITSEHFRHDLVALWNHSSYFMIVQAALVSVFVTVIGPREPDSVSGLVSARQEGLLLATIGLIFALFWSLVTHRRVVLIEQWRSNVVHLDGCVDRHGVYLTVEPKVGARWWYGPSALTARLPWLISVMWLVSLAVLAVA